MIPFLKQILCPYPIFLPGYFFAEFKTSPDFQVYKRKSIMKKGTLIGIVFFKVLYNLIVREIFPNISRAKLFTLKDWNLLSNYTKAIIIGKLRVNLTFINSFNCAMSRY